MRHKGHGPERRKAAGRVAAVLSQKESDRKNAWKEKPARPALKEKSSQI